MAKEIRWSKRAALTFENVVQYLENEWSPKEVKKFIEATYGTIRYISENPAMFRKTDKKIFMRH
jgi:plasmid stabilization system protein ParE